MVTLKVLLFIVTIFHNGEDMTTQTRDFPTVEACLEAGKATTKRMMGHKGMDNKPAYRNSYSICEVTYVD